jgi:MYXO-CTERM domain-containing protein
MPLSHRCSWLPAVLAATLLLVLVPERARAFPELAAQVPNVAYATNDVGESRPCITCHNNANGGDGCVASGGMKPCHNPFGAAFGAAGRQWSAAVASGDADGDGFTNGQELQDAAGTWFPGLPAPGNASYVTRPGFPESTPGAFDADDDGFCWVGRDTNNNGSCLDPGENDGAFDCNDNVASVNSAAVELCTDLADNDCDGLPTVEDPECAQVVDADDDGYCLSGRDLNADGDCLDNGEPGATVDCDDTQPTANPGAFENCTDTVDNDCDGDIDMLDSACTGEADEDNDGFCPIGSDLNDDGDCLDDGESLGEGDCNDQNASVNPNIAEVCTDVVDNDCDGFPDFRDLDCADLADSDEDGFCPLGIDLNDDGNCAGTNESDGSAQDCNDANQLVYPTALEICTDATDQDCDGEPSLGDPDCAGYLDSDGDEYCAVGRDLNLNGNCLDPGEFGLAGDCNDASDQVNPATEEGCFDSLDNDCDGSVDAFDSDCSEFSDTDRDGYCSEGRDLNGDADCTDASEQTGDMDAAPNDGTIYPGAPEHCSDNKDNDQDGLLDLDDGDCTTALDNDGDGFCPLGIDRNDDGDCLDDGENDRYPDCNDNDVNVFPGADELCQDFRDNDCDTRIDLEDLDSCGRYLDVDGDGFCGAGIDDTSDGDCLDLGEDRFGADCDDSVRSINPRAGETCDDGIDNDCDGRVDAADSDCNCSSNEQCPAAGDCTLGVCLHGDCTVVPDRACEDSADCTAQGGGSSSAPYWFGLVIGLAWLARRRWRISNASTFLVALVIGGASLPTTAYAFPTYVNTRYGLTALNEASYTAECSDCHVNPAGGGGAPCGPSSGGQPWASCLNPFGILYRNNGWTVGVRNGDVDGDGTSNENEFLDVADAGGSPGSAGFPRGAEDACDILACASAFPATVACGATNIRCTASRANGPAAHMDAVNATSFNYAFSFTCVTGSSPVPVNNDTNWSDRCLDQNECAGNPCSPGACNQFAIGGAWQSPGYFCSGCPSGYQLNGTSTACVLIDECAANVDDCVGVATCNDPSSAVGNFTCTCPAGYMGNGEASGTGCVDINECAGSPCGPNGVSCSQTPIGSWSSPGYSCTCAMDYAFDGTTCVLTNECTALPAPCTAGLATCLDPSAVDGDVQCDCADGYVGDGFAMGTGCTNINECTTAMHNCSPLAACIDNPGSFSCVCNPGTTGNGTSCTNINECASPQPCGVGGTCTERALGGTWSAPGYNCSCTAGYTNSGGTCALQNECLANLDDCVADATCTDPGVAVGNFECECDNGFSGDGSASGSGCTNDDECLLESDNCSPNAACVDTVGSFTCTCNAGFFGNGVNCTDINECLSNTDNCSVFADCTNTPGSFTCACKSGYQGTGISCIDIDECVTDNPCVANEVCRNAAGGPPTCDCAPGFTRVLGICERSCGDGVKSVGEACDDGNIVPEDGCDPSCQIEAGWSCFEPPSSASQCTNTCGDGVIDYPAEQCDDGEANNDTAPNACRAVCTAPACGDGVQDDGEDCDDGAGNSPTTANACRPTCQLAFCGDGIVDFGEVCDPGLGDPLSSERCVQRCYADAGVGGGGGCSVSRDGSGSPAGWLALVALVLFGARRRQRGKTPTTRGRG